MLFIPPIITIASKIASISPYNQALSAYNLLLKQNSVISTASGIITDVNKNLSIGEYISEGEHLAEVVAKINNKSLILEYEVPSQYANQVKLGQNLSFSPSYKKKDTKYIYKAQVNYISPKVNPNSSSITIRAQFINQFNPKNMLYPNIKYLSFHYKSNYIPIPLNINYLLIY